MVDRSSEPANGPAVAGFTLPDERFGFRVGPLILVAAVVLAVMLGQYAGEGGNLLIAGAGIAVLIAGLVVLSVPLLGFAAIILVIATNASDNFIEFFGLPSMAKLMLPAAILLLGYRWLGYGERPLFDARATWLLGGYAAIMLLSTPFALNWNGTVGALSDFLKDVTAALLIVAFFAHRKAMPVFFGTLFAAGLFICTLVLYKYTLGEPNFDYYGFARTRVTSGRLAGPIWDPNYFGALLILFSVPAIYYLVYGSKLLLRGLAAYGIAAIVICIFLTGSRGTLVAVVAMAGLALLLFDRRVALKLGVVFALIAFASATLMSEQLVERYGTILNIAEGGTIEDTSVQGRLAQWIVAVNTFLDHPIVGVGAGNYNVRFQDYSLDLGLMFRNGEARRP
jgi:hypothetical protein